MREGGAVTAGEILARLDGVTSAGEHRWMARCPAHDDETPSLSIHETPDGRTLLHCHAGCRSDEVTAAMGVEMRDLFERSSGNGGGFDIAATYDYTDEDGRLLYQVVRLSPKGFRQRRPDGAGGWSWRLGDVERVLYLLPAVREAARSGETVYVVEGEKDADRLASLGLAATTAPGGAGRWRAEYAEALRGVRMVAITPDADEPGRKHAEDVARSVRAVVPSVRLIELPDLPEHGDVSDWLDAGGTVEDLHRLVDEAPDWTPEPVEETWPTLRDLYDRPGLLEAPDTVVPRLAWRGRHTILAGLAKIGKSTLAAQAAAAVTRGDSFLDGEADRGRVAWLGVDEHLGDTARRLVTSSAWPNNVRLLAAPPDDLRASLENLIAEWAPDLVVVDSLIEWARRTTKESPASGDAAAWAAVIRPLTAVAHDRDVAVLTLHHAKKSDGRYRDSGEIAAGVDAIYDMLGPRGGEDRALRRFEGVGRWHVGRWRTAFVDGRYEWRGEVEDAASTHLDEGMVERVRETLASEPTRSIESKAELVRRLGASSNAVYAALDDMETRGEVEVEHGGVGRASRVTLLTAGSTEETAGSAEERT